MHLQLHFLKMNYAIKRSKNILMHVLLRGEYFPDAIKREQPAFILINDKDLQQTII